MRSFRIITGLLFVFGLMTAASAQVTFSSPRFSPVQFRPVVFQRPQWTPRQSITNAQPVQQFSTVRFTPTVFQRDQFQPLNFQRQQFVNPILSGTHRTSKSGASHPAASPAQTGRAARTSLSRFSQGVGSLK